MDYYQFFVPLMDYYQFFKHAKDITDVYFEAMGLCNKPLIQRLVKMESLEKEGSSYLKISSIPT